MIRLTLSLALGACLNAFPQEPSIVVGSVEQDVAVPVESFADIHLLPVNPREIFT